MLRSNLFSEALGNNDAVIPVRVEALIQTDADGRAVVGCRNLDVEEFADRGHCWLQPLDDPRPAAYRYWGGEDHDRLYSSFQQVVWQVTWSGQSLQVVHLEWSTQCGQSEYDWVVAESPELADSFILDVNRKTHSPGESILVFSSGSWHRSRGLYQATQSASFDDLVLADDLKETIRSDFRHFLTAEDRYHRLEMAWRRGALLIGPPGNGKTHCVRALVKELNIASLYVQSLKHPYMTTDQTWRAVFERARGLSPCVLVLEDLDALINDENRSFFLNQLDGFERNHGLIVLATTNHPDRIDPAIIDRPSRFDRKYHFNLPSLSEREVYLADWQQRLAGETNWAAESLPIVAAETDGFSFAYLKELVISAVMKWMHSPATEFTDVLSDQCDLLRRQMTTTSEPLVATTPGSRSHVGV
ncbi:MAG: ATP-binding protein [Planctomycetaceae bacterium]|nr:ATP-binding protein [Planctomycetaceae bacterium]